MKPIVIFLSIISAVCGYKILCFQTVPSKSHYHLMKGIVTPLLKAGHKITFVTTFPEMKPTQNLRIINVSHIQKITQYMDMTHRTQQGLSVVRDFGRNITIAAMETPAVKDVLVKEQFDAVVSEWFFSDVEAGFAAIQEAPWILLSGMVLHSHMEGIIDAVRSVPTIPAIHNDSPIPMSFWSRVMNTFAYFYMSYFNLSDYPTVISDYETYFAPLASSRGVILPPFSSALHNVSILFVNSHPSFVPAMSLPPNVVDIGGYHIDEDVPALPKDLQEILDSSTQGVIYFSMGSVLKSSQLPEETKRSLVKIFGELPYTVLWKFEEQLDNLPKNVHIRPWLPQTGILAHKNLKVFITHGGLLSTLESLHFGVPVITIPVFGDQPSNALRAVRSGYALKVTFSPDMGAELKGALNEMLNNDSYYKQAKYLSKLFRNRPVTTTKLIQHYVELAIESKGAYHLRSKTHLYKWYELWMLDQLALLLAVLYIVYNVFKKIISQFRSKKTIMGRKEKRH